MSWRLRCHDSEMAPTASSAPPVLETRHVWCRDCCADAPGRRAVRAIRGRRVSGSSRHCPTLARTPSASPLDYPASSGLDHGDHEGEHVLGHLDMVRRLSLVTGNLRTRH